MLRLYQDGKDGKHKMVKCYGAIARFCQTDHSLMPLVVQIRKYWDPYLAQDEMHPGLQDILFALEHFHVNVKSKVVFALCKPIWRSMINCENIVAFVEQFILFPMCSALTFEARVLVGRHIAAQFESAFELELKRMSIFARKDQPPECIICNCVCNKQQNLFIHACEKECDLIEIMISDMFEQSQEQQRSLKRSRQ